VVQGFDGKVRVHAVQPSGCATVVDAWNRRQHAATAVASTTAISGLSVPTDIDATLALTRLYECGGRGIAVSDAEVFDAQRAMLSTEGIYCEPAGATAFAGYRRAKADGWIGEGETAVCLVTGHGFKDPASIEKAAATHESPLIESAGVRDLIEEHRRHAG
jgi:threonine synthase